jgi:hypothetical protein
MDMKKIIEAIEEIENKPEPGTLDGILHMTPEERNAELRRLIVGHLSTMPQEDFNNLLLEIVQTRTDHPVLPINWAGSSILGVEYGADGKPIEKQAMEQIQEAKPAVQEHTEKAKPRIYTDEKGIIHGETEEERLIRIKNQISKGFAHDEYGEPIQ